MNKPALMELDMAGLKELLTQMGQPAYRAKQVWEGLLKGKDVSEMSNLPYSLRTALQENTRMGGAKIIERLVSAHDDTVKYLFELDDGEYVEGVVLGYEYGKTLCLSTQVGCRMGCAFCASTKGGLIRNLLPGEMLSQVLQANRDQSPDGSRVINHLVLMGSGEPLDNYDNVLQFLRRVTSAEGFNLGARNISLSTCGLPHKIRELAQSGLQVTLCISLHCADAARRSEIMPINKAYPLPEVIKAAKDYALTTGRRVIFEYALIKGQNDRYQDAQQIAGLIKGFPAHINVIPLNAAKGSTLEGSSQKEALRFVGLLEKLGLSATKRRTMGEDIEGACGQLRRRKLEEGKEELQ